MTNVLLFFSVAMEAQNLETFREIVTPEPQIQAVPSPFVFTLFFVNAIYVVNCQKSFVRKTTISTHPAVMEQHLIL